MLTPTLYQFFRRHVQRGFGMHGIDEPATVDYVSDVLTRFAHTPALYSIKDSTTGISLERIAQLLVEWRRAQGGDEGRADRGREALVIRHIGEYAMFMSGLFRERLRARGELNYYLDNGRSAYWRSADYEHNPARARVFRRLYYDLERIAVALDAMRREQFPLELEGFDTNTPVVALWRN